jgi:hypothetical protein
MSATTNKGNEMEKESTKLANAYNATSTKWAEILDAVDFDEMTKEQAIEYIEHIRGIRRGIIAMFRLSDREAFIDC